jgi:hypothetical protein
MLIVSVVSGCATTSVSKATSSTRDGTQSSSEHKKDEGKGFENFWNILAVGLLMGIVFKTAPKEAYR